MTTLYEQLSARVRTGELTPIVAADLLIDQMTDDELLWMLDGDTSAYAMIRLPAKIKAGPISAGVVERLGIPGIRFTDGPRGVVCGAATAFPVTIARAATWDTDLERQVGLAMGREARAMGANYSGAVCVNVLRHPAWGRAQESYGEDPMINGRMGVALTQGLRPNVMACVKHYALNSMENARFKVDVTVDEHPLHEVYLPHFKAIVDAGADSVMSSYNSVNGEYVGENRVLLTDILRDEWGFTGTVTSDWVYGTHDGVKSLEAGMDMEMPVRMLRARELPDALAEGRVSRQTIVRSVRRILSTGLAHEAQQDPTIPHRDVIAGRDHRDLARAVAIRGSVLLKNDDVGGRSALPLDDSLRRLAVIGSLAAEANIGDHGSSLVHPPSTSSPLDGLREALPGAAIDHVDGADLTAARNSAARADAVVVVVGMGFEDEGERIENDEGDPARLFGFPFTLPPVKWLMSKLGSAGSQFGRGGDRELLTLHPRDETLIDVVAKANPRTAVVVIGGSAIIMENWREQVPAILMAWYPGMEGGRAIADILIGKEEPGGRLPVSIPTRASHLPFFDAEARSIVYDASWGQRKLDRDGHAAAFPLGFGLGYTTFEAELQRVDNSDVDGVASVFVRNTGDRAGSTVVQVYAVDASADRVVPQLVGFGRVNLDPGESTVLDVTIDLTPTRERDPQTRTWSTRPGSWHVLAAQHSPDTMAGAVDLQRNSGGPRD